MVPNVPIAAPGTVNQFNVAYPGTTVQTVLIDQRLVQIETYVNNIFNPPAPPAGPPTGPTGTGTAGS